MVCGTIFSPQKSSKRCFGRGRPVEGIPSIEELQMVFYLQKTCGRTSVHRIPLGSFQSIKGLQKGFYSQKACGMSSINIRPVLRDQKGSSDRRRSVEGILSVEDQWKVFYPQNICGSYFIYRRSVEGLLSIEYLWKLFYLYKISERSPFHKKTFGRNFSTEALGRSSIQKKTC